MDSLPPNEFRALTDSAFQWAHLARENQIAPEGDWLTWLLLAGRGFGKTRTGAEYIRERVTNVKRCRRLTIAAPTSADVRDIAIEGESGLLNVFPPHQRPDYEPSKRRVTFHTGARASLLSADKPDRFRGVQSDTVWAEELASWRYPEAWDHLMLGFRLGEPKAVVTTTPRPTKIIKGLVKDPTTHVTRGSTFDNRRNLAPAFLKTVTARYEGTRMGRQELYAEILEEIEGAFIHLAMIDGDRVEEAPEMMRCVVGVDPAATSGEDADETGIVVVGKGIDSEGYVLADRSCRASPTEWARRAVEAYYDHKADRIIAEKNMGGEMVESVIRSVDRTVPIKLVTATRGKHVRAEPVCALYEQGRMHHVGTMALLEDQMCGFTPAGYEGGDSPDRADACVWAATDLFVKNAASWEDLYPSEAA